MNRNSLCRSDSKIRNPIRWNTGTRSSLQNDNSFRGRRSSSAEGRGRVSGGLPKPRCSSEERKSSLFPRISGRKSSLCSNEQKILKEVRPLTDKAYQRKRLTELVEYLATSDFKPALGVSRLMQGSKKDFEIIFKHLVFFYDPQYEVKRIEEEAPKILKGLFYPFIPPKSSFTCVTRTNWPHLLGILFFLMDMNKFTEPFNHKMFFSSGGFDRPKEHEVLLKYIFDCYFSRENNEEEEAKVFTKMITARGNYNIQDLHEENVKLSSELEELQREVDAINELKSRSAQQDADIAHYEDYFKKMQKHKKRKEVQCQKLSEDLISKESELKDLREMMVKKQAVFDAQGFDGKKQLSYFESQKTDLQEKLQAVQAKLKDVQNQCWDMELQQSKAVDQGNSVCEKFNNMYSRLNETSRSVLEPLSTVTDPQVRNICSSFKLDFPDYRMVPTQACLVRDRHERKAFLEKLNKKIESANLIFKGMATQQNQKLNEVRTENDKLSLELKVIKSQEQSKERELSMMEKQAVKEVNAMEAEIDDLLKSLQQVQAERAKAEEENAELKEELKEIVELKKNWQKKLDDYLEEQKKLFEFHQKSIEKIEGDVEKQQEKILATMEKYLKD